MVLPEEFQQMQRERAHNKREKAIAWFEKFKDVPVINHIHTTLMVNHGSASFRLATLDNMMAPEYANTKWMYESSDNNWIINTGRIKKRLRAIGYKVTLPLVTDRQYQYMIVELKKF
jgi:hypothetical protein